MGKEDLLHDPKGIDISPLCKQVSDRAKNVSQVSNYKTFDKTFFGMDDFHFAEFYMLLTIKGKENVLSVWETAYRKGEVSFYFKNTFLSVN